MAALLYKKIMMQNLSLYLSGRKEEVNVKIDIRTIMEPLCGADYRWVDAVAEFRNLYRIGCSFGHVRVMVAP